MLHQVAISRNKIKEMVEKKKKKKKKRGIWIGKTYSIETKKDFEGGIKQMWVEIKKRDTGQASRRGRHRNSYLKGTER